MGLVIDLSAAVVFVWPMVFEGQLFTSNSECNNGKIPTSLLYDMNEKFKSNNLW